MNVPALVSVSATLPLFALVIGEDTRNGSDDLLIVLYVCAVGLLVSFAALLDDAYDLTSWFGFTPGALEAF